MPGMGYRIQRRLRRALQLCLAVLILTTGCATGDASLDAAQPVPPVPPAGRPAPASETASDSPSAPVSDAAPLADNALLPGPRVEALLSSLTLRERVGQRFISYLPGDRPSHGAAEIIMDAAPAGFIIYPWNFDNAEELERLTSSLQHLARQTKPGIGLLICTDQEGGRVATLRSPEYVQTPSARAMAQLAAESGDTRTVEYSAYLTGVQLRSLGINMNLAPVLDVYPNDDRTVIGDRSFSDDAQFVADLAGAYLRGAERSGIIPVAKHFPGHGVTAVDSHHQLPVVGGTVQQLRSSHLLPFQAAVDAGVPAIMTAHVLYEDIDPEFPATLSRTILVDLLREDMGFRGVVMCDGLEMGAIRYNFEMEDTLVQLFRNDVDLILLYVNDQVSDLVDTVMDLIRRRKITVDDVDRGARRVLQLKLDYGLADPEAP
jgi:beta-N-acetylhexosaminidase